MKMHLLPFILGCLLLCSCVGCTVRENRLVCPCALGIDYRPLLVAPAFDREVGRVDVALYGPDRCWSACHPLQQCPEVEEVLVDKAGLRLVALMYGRPWQDFLAEGTRVVCAPGQEMAALYAHSVLMDCTVEEVNCVLHPRKQFSTLTITDEADGELCRRYDMAVRGTTCGFDATDCSAIEGPYRCPVQNVDSAGRSCVRIPRQLRGDLLLDFSEKGTETPLFSCPIGAYLFATGYDPTAEDLTDYTLKIDFREALLYLAVADWKDEYIYSLYD